LVECCALLGSCSPPGSPGGPPTVPWAGATPAGRSTGGGGLSGLQETSIPIGITGCPTDHVRSGLSFDLGRFDPGRGAGLRKSTSRSNHSVHSNKFFIWDNAQYKLLHAAVSLGDHCRINIYFSLHTGFRCFPDVFLPPLPRAISAAKQIKITRNGLSSELKISQNGWKLGVLCGNMRRMFTNRPDGPTKEKKGKAREKRVTSLAV
jgi:hypothetical protein